MCLEATPRQCGFVRLHSNDMKTADVREIRNRLSAYLRMVEQGERVTITHRGTVVAELGPPTHATEEEAHSELRRRARAGTVRLGAPNRPDIYPRPAGRLPSQVVQELLDGTRGARWHSTQRRVPSWPGSSTKKALAVLAWSELVATDAVHTSDLTLI